MAPAESSDAKPVHLPRALFPGSPMIAPDAALSLETLAKHAELPVRTIRYYMQVGLLEAPPFRGRETTYPGTYVNRLKAIRQLRTRLLPLDRIAVLLEPLTLEQVALVADGMLTIDPTGRLLLQGPGSSPHPRIVDPFHPATPASGEAGREAAVVPTTRGQGSRSRAARPEAIASPAAASTWRRLELVPGVELHVDVERLVADGRVRGPAGGLRLASRLESAVRAALEGTPGDEGEATRA